MCLRVAFHSFHSPVIFLLFSKSCLPCYNFRASVNKWKELGNGRKIWWGCLLKRLWRGPNLFLSQRHPDNFTMSWSNYESKMRTKATLTQNWRWRTLILANSVKCLLTAREITAVCSLLHWTTLSSLEKCYWTVYLDKVLKFSGNGIVPIYSNWAMAQDHDSVCDTLHHLHVTTLLGVISLLCPPMSQTKWSVGCHHPVHREVEGT